MPKNKDLKRLVRARMQKTGESYAAARAQLLRKAPSAPPAPPPDYAALSGMSGDTVLDRTGRTWEQWVRVLDALGATKMSHGAVARHVHDVYSVSGWWAQAVTVGYERIRGLRQIGQRRGGGYEANKSRTYPVAVGRLYRAFGTPRARRRWLAEAEVHVRTAVPQKSMRWTWTDGTRVELYFTARGARKSQVAVQHRNLATKADADRRKEFWTERLAALAAIFVPGR